jgi:membrane-associated phospholipid phosphatase
VTTTVWFVPEPGCPRGCDRYENVVKTNIDRTRPRSADKGQAKRPQKGNHTAKEKTSFPSGHSAGAMAAARAVSREFPEYGAAAIGGATLVSASQVPRCAHYPTDVATGVLIGLITEVVTNVAWNAAEMDERSVD